jgi:hypothetical protein
MYERFEQFGPSLPCMLQVMLDTEGIDAWDQTGQYSVQIFSLAVLLSSLFVYNQMGGIDEAALDRLSLVTEMTKHIRVRAANSGGFWTWPPFCRVRVSGGMQETCGPFCLCVTSSVAVDCCTHFFTCPADARYGHVTCRWSISNFSVHQNSPSSLPPRGSRVYQQLRYALVNLVLYSRLP